MPEEEKAKSEATAKKDSAEDYIKAIKDLKENTVPKAEYERKVEENRKLLQTLVEGGQLSKEEEEEAKKTSDDYARELMKPHTNLEYAKIALKQREKAIEEGKGDPFVPRGLNFDQGTSHDQEDAQAAADLLQSCIDDSNDDPEAFRALFQARTKDLPIMKMKAQARKG